MKTTKTILNIVASLAMTFLFALFLGNTIESKIDINPLNFAGAVTLTMVIVALVAMELGLKPSKLAYAGLIKEVWVNAIQETLNMDAAFLPYSTDHSDKVAFGIVHLPQSGANPTVLVDPTVFPLAIAPRTDTDRTYSLIRYALEPTVIDNLDEIQVSYDKRQSVIGQQISTLVDTIGTRVAYSWAATAASSIVSTTGSTSTSNLAPGATGSRKMVTLADIANCAKKLDKDNVPRSGRKMLMQADMFWELFTISDVVRASYNGFQTNALATGVVAQLFGFDIMIRPTVAIYAASATTPTAVGAATTTGDCNACIAWHPQFVSRALGAMNPMYDAGSSGTGKPDYLGKIFNMEVILGSAILRTDLKGIVTLVQVA